MRNECVRLSDSICEEIQAVRDTVDQQALDELGELGYGSGFKPDGTEFNEALMADVENDLHKVREIVARYVSRRDSKQARLEVLASRVREIVGLL